VILGIRIRVLAEIGILVVVVVVVVRVGKDRCIDGGFDGGSIPVGDSSRRGLSQRGDEDGGDFEGVSRGGGGGSSPSSAGRR
jgi:uncharacterized membrane protein